MERYVKEHEFSEPLRIDYADKKWALQRAYLDDLDEQRNLAEAVALVSPSETFRLICGALCRTDVDSHYRFMDRVRRYREELISYFEDKRIFLSYLYFTPQPPETLKTADEIVRIRTGGQFKTLQEYGAAGGGFKPLRKVEIPESDPGSYPFLDLSDVPGFRWQIDSMVSDSAIFWANKVFSIEHADTVSQKINTAYEEIERNAPEGCWSSDSGNPFSSGAQATRCLPNETDGH